MEIDDHPSLYFQSPAHLQLDESGNLWRLPREPDYSRTKGVGDLKLASICFASYSKRCAVLHKNWKAGNAGIIPKELMSTTPYSLALLDKLSTLSKHSKNLRPFCHDLFVTYVQKRTELTQSLATPWFVTYVTEINVEERIKERIDGITLSDVDHVLEAVKMRTSKSERKEHIEQAKAQVEQMNQDAASRAAARLKATRENSFRFQRELQDQRAGKVELVDVEWIDDNTAPRSKKTLNKKQLNKMVREQTSKSRLLARQQTLNSKTTVKQPRSRAGTKRAVTLAEISANLKDEYAWHDTDSEEDEDADVPETQRSILPDPGSLSPGRHRSHRKRERGPRGIRNYMDDIHTDEKSEMSRDSKNRHTVWLKKVLDSSVQLPSERFDLSTLGKLQTGAEKAQINDMGAALDDMMH